MVVRACSVPDAYGYECLAADLIDVLDARAIERAVLAGASMGAHTAIRLALEEPDLVAGLVIITPAFHPDHPPGLERWDRLSEALRTDGVDGLRRGLRRGRAPRAKFRDTVLKVVRQRLERHEHPEAVADALRCVPRSKPFESLDALAEITAPTIVVPAATRPTRATRSRSARVRGPHPGRRAACRGRGLVPAGLAGRPALEGHRRAGGPGLVPVAQPIARDIGAQVDHEGEHDEEPFEPGHVVAGTPVPHGGVGQRRPWQQEEPEERDGPAVERAAQEVVEEPQQEQDKPRGDQREEGEQAADASSLAARADQGKRAPRSLRADVRRLLGNPAAEEARRQGGRRAWRGCRRPITSTTCSASCPTA